MSPPLRPDLTKAVLLWTWDLALVDQEPDPDKLERVRKTVKSELLRLGLIDAIGDPTPEGRRLLGLI